MIGVLLLGLCALLVLRFLRYRQRYVRALRSIPGPPGVPVLGNSIELLRCDTTALHDKIALWTSQYTPRLKIDVCNTHWIMHTSPELIEQIVTNATFNRKAKDYDYLHEWLGVGILLDHGPNWFKHRKALTEAFHFKVLENFMPIYQEQSAILVNKLLEHRGRPVNVFPLLKLYTLDVILETAMGVHCRAQQNDSDYVRAVAGLTQITFWRMYNVLGQSDLAFRFSQYYQPYQRMIKVSNDFTMEVIGRRRNEMEEKVAAAGDDEFGSNKRRSALLDKLLRMEIDGRKLTDEEIRDQVNSFMFAGHDTTSSALTFILYLLAKHPDIQRKLYQEVKQVFGDSKHPTFTQSTLNELKFMDQVIKEALRLYPSVPYISRTVDVDVELAGVTYPAGTTISLGIFFMHRNPAYFPEPTRFKPERFAPGVEIERKNPYVYIPFSAGSRNCIGQKFAMNEMKTAISHIILRCEVELEDPDLEPRLKDELILKPADGMPIKFMARD